MAVTDPDLSQGSHDHLFPKSSCSMPPGRRPAATSGVDQPGVSDFESVLVAVNRHQTGMLDLAFRTSSASPPLPS